MRSKALPYILLALLALAVFFLRTCRSLHISSWSRNERLGPQGKEINRDRGFDRRISYLEYTKHARCRMQCRQITPSEVQEIMHEGDINYHKSEVDAKPCPTYALEGYTHDNQHLRVVFAQCDYKTRVVTCIDLDKEWQCDCPGDDQK